jgi:FkbM family methyltransferase
MKLGHFKQYVVLSAKQFWYGSRGESITYGSHRLKYLPGSRPVRLKYANSSDIVARNDARQIQFFMDYVRSGDEVFDIGGHIADYAELFDDLVGATGKVDSFEPDVVARPMLKANVELNKFADRVRIEELAVFDNSAAQQFFTRNGNAQSSLARAGLGGSESNDDVACYSITSVRLDEYVRQSELPAPRIIKLDVEGAEVRALRGAGDLLSSNALIVCELHPYAWKELGTSFDDLLKIVHDSGRTIRYLDENLKIENGPVYGAVVIR